MAKSNALVCRDFDGIDGSIACPAIAISLLNAYKLYCEHYNHSVHGPLPEEKVEFPYQNIRTKNFFWGDGDKTLFWNDKVNYHAKPEPGE
jgi:cytochrome c oxidase subunit 6a